MKLQLMSIIDLRLIMAAIKRIKIERTTIEIIGLQKSSIKSYYSIYSFEFYE